LRGFRESWENLCFAGKRDDVFWGCERYGLNGEGGGTKRTEKILRLIEGFKKGARCEKRNLKKWHKKRDYLNKGEEGFKEF